jgi:hypothetical protein
MKNVETGYSTKFYPTLFSAIELHVQKKLLTIISADLT